MTPIIAFIIGFVAGGVTCAISAKTLGWFNKQVKSVETRIP